MTQYLRRPFEDYWDSARNRPDRKGAYAALQRREG